MRSVLLLCILIGITHNTFAQGTATTAPDPIKKCVDIPIQDRIKIHVSRFTISTSGTTSYGLENFSTLLENALVSIECFRVLGMDKDNVADVAGTENEEESMEEKPQYIIAGEITNLYVESKNKTISLIGKHSEIAHVTIVVKIKQGKDILWTQKFECTGTSENKRTSVWAAVAARAGKGHFIAASSYSSENNTPVDKAFKDAMDAGLDLAMNYIVDHRDEMVNRGNTITNKGTGQTNTLLVVKNATYSLIQTIEKKLKASPDVIKVTTVFKNGIAKISIVQKGSYDGIVTLITDQLRNVIEITGSEPSLNRISAAAR